ncbi:MAG: tRNA glutamyl-Q(34) synthetase GluQRS [Propionibacteriaceae bacterium]
MTAAGRYAPSPTSDLHLGNLRTAMVAWLLARSTGRRFLLRIDDLDQQRVAAAPAVAQRQLADLARLGLDADGPVLRQSERLELYRDAVAQLDRYPCFCTRREIAQAASAPHAIPGRYPGTCRELTAAQRSSLAAQRQPAWRVHAHGATATITDLWAGAVSACVDDIVVVRNDGVFAYNLASVVDDGLTGVDQVCRGRDLLPISPTQAWLGAQLGFAEMTYAHIGLVTNAQGVRLAKRDGAVTLADLAAQGMSVAAVRGRLAESLGLADAGECPDMAMLLDRFESSSITHDEWIAY